MAHKQNKVHYGTKDPRSEPLQPAEPNPDPSPETSTDIMDADTDDSPRAHRAFTAQQLTPTMFLITEVDDIYGERPFIYAKRVPAARTILLLDTGCGGATNAPEASFRRLRDFLEYAGHGQRGPASERRRGVQVRGFSCVDQDPHAFLQAVAPKGSIATSLGGQHSSGHDPSAHTRPYP